ncbi:MAG: 2'-5' RNA ligase family protein [Thermostichus sp. DG02_5_bins_236]
MSASKQRLFLALLPPLPLQEQVRALQQEFVDRFSSRAALRSPPHITLVPPFEWPRSEWPALIGSLRVFATSQDSISVELSGFGAFAPHVIYIQVVPSSELQQLQSAVQTLMQPLLQPKNPATPSRPFVPHITLAFRDLTPGNFRAAWPEFQPRRFQAAFEATDLTLLQHDGQQWQVAEQFSFGSGSG